MFFLFQRYRTIFVHLDNTFYFFSYTCVLCMRTSFESLHQNKQTSKTKKKTYSFSDIRYSNYWYQKSFSAIRKYLRNIKTAPHKYWNCHKEIHDVAKKWKVGSFLFPGFTACRRCVSNHVVLANQKTPVYKVSLSSQIPKLNTD